MKIKLLLMNYCKVLQGDRKIELNDSYISCILILGQLGGELVNVLCFLYNISENKKFIYILYCNISRVVFEVVV